MIELTVKTLDSKNHAFSVPDDVTVKQLKERIAESISIPADSQRLIYCGRVLQDEKNLSEYDVNGKVIHLVQRAPPGSNTGGPTSSRTTTGAPGGRRNQQWRNFFGHGGNSGNAMYLGAMAFPAEIVDLSAMRQPRQCLSQSRLDVVRSMLQRCATLLNWLEDPSTETAETNGENSRSESTQPANNDEANSASAGAAAAAVASTPLVPEATFVIDGQQIDTVEGGTVNSEAAPNTASEQNRESPDGEAQASAQQPAENGEAPSRYPRTTALAELIDQTVETNTRLQPFMAEYQQLLRDDPTFVDNAAQLSNRLFSHVSEIMHNMAHAYHALSDIMCDFEQPPPRILRCRPVLIQHSAVVQTGIPIQVSSGPNDNAGQETTNGGGATAAATPADGPARPTQESSPSPTQLPEPPLEWAEQARLQEARVMANRGMRFTRVDGPPGLEVFVDVGPGSITIDSVETTVVTNASGNTTEQNGWQNPPEFVQSLLTAVAGQLMGAPGLAPGLVSVASATTPATTPATTSATTSAPPGAPTGAQNSQARGNTATHPTTATQTRSTPRPHVHLAPSINGLRTNNYDPFLPCNSHHIRGGRGGRQRAGQNQAQNPTNTTNPTNATNQATPVEPRVPPRAPPSNISISVRAGRGNIPVARIAPEGSTQARLAAELQRFIQERRGTDASAPPGASYPPQFANLIQAMHSADGPATLAQVLENMPGYSYTPGESILIDIFMTLAQSLSFMDMVQLGLGRSDCLVRARPRLRQLISERLLNNQPLTPPAITRIIDTFNAELTPIYNTFNRARLREEVDLPASVNLYNHSTLPGILRTIIDEDESTFHRSLMQKSISYVRQLCALILYCCLDGEDGMEAILHAFVVQMTVGVPDALQDWTMSQSFINFRSFMTTINSHSEDVKRHLVYRSNKSAGSSQASTTTPPVAEPMDTLDLADLSSPPNNATAILNQDWQNPLPSDWVPIITRDSQRQRRQNPQGPFSDAYMSGMPSKRRKLITSAKPQGNLSQVITESMATALGAAGMSSGPVVEVIAQRAGEDTQLRSAYREQIRSTLHYNLNTNQDYLPEKYPNTTKYLKK